ncbi:carboxylic ester hydrolase [Streptomyces longisporoflavus]|uniref:carboxylesterase/lipase family protein n=1 Tax=Streptomyces longisporoflavus TaxID=28044 RepID=UPI00167EE1ED|nr:carboxylesterase family protein [Streptomyces longisporoflavus]GGV29747.1 carboxylic ester hydrolase [Streptomyces longisporoflavus]
MRLSSAPPTRSRRLFATTVALLGIALSTAAAPPATPSRADPVSTVRAPGPAGTPRTAATATDVAADPAAAAAATPPIVRTEQGRIQGRRLAATGTSTNTAASTGTSTDVDFFGKIPYAAAPTGSLRWRPPQPPRSWKGTRDGGAPSPACPQTENSNGPRSETEDCLYLDVWRPDTTAARTGKAPVLFWIFGGGGINGSGSQYDARKLAAETGSVVVTVNHRLGWLGFLALPELSEASPDRTSGQFGFQDQIAALGWLKKNAAAFGGDPRQVTVAGQSAGGRAVCRLLTSPRAAGLFRRAVIQSGACNADALAPREHAGTSFAAAVGCGGERSRAATLACLRGKSVSTLIDRPNPPGTPAIGGTALPRDPQQAIESGRFTRVPVLVGNTHDENRPYPGISQPATDASLKAWIDRTYPALADEVSEQYAAMEPADAAGAIASDTDRVCRAWKIENALARHTPVYAYEFDDFTAPAEAVTPGFAWGAYHTTELEYLFDFTRSDGSAKFLTGLNPRQEKLAREMRDDWGTFVSTGKPAPRSTWPAYRPGRHPAVLQFQLSGARVTHHFAEDHRCGFWDEHGLIKLA